MLPFDGLALKQIRQTVRLTLRELSDKTGVSVTYLCEMENNKRKNPSVGIVAEIAQACGRHPLDVIVRVFPALRADYDSMKQWADFGQQCYQDRCENAYVEASVVKRMVDSANKVAYDNVRTQRPANQSGETRSADPDMGRHGG